MIKKFFSIVIIIFCSINFKNSYGADLPQLLLRVDGVGMNHATNLGLKAIAETSIPFSASVMFACPWYQEAVEILKENPHIAVGVHLTLNAEWKHYRWEPVLGQAAVPSLVDSDGYFFPSTQQFLEQNYQLKEVEKELEAQIQRAIASGLNISYIDFHMRTALQTPELKSIVIRLAKKYQLITSMLMGEKEKSMFNILPKNKKSDFLRYLRKDLDQNAVNLVVIHAAKATPENSILVDI